MSEDTKKRFHAIVSGRVQGVGFRYFVQRTASEYGLTGWVRNRLDRTVEVVAEGDEAGLSQLIGAIRKGPTGSNVTELEITWKNYTGEFESFKVKWVG